MRWPDERYVKAYTRDTPDWLALGWEARALFWELLRKADRAGLFELGKSGNRGISAVTGIPHDVVDRALAILLEDGCVELHGTYLLIRNYIEAQEANQSDKARQRRSRETARDKARVYDGDESQNVTSETEPVTIRDEKSNSVTPILAIPAIPAIPEELGIHARARDPRPRARPRTAHELQHLLKVAVEKHQPENGFWNPGPFGAKEAHEFLEGFGDDIEAALDTIEERIQIFAKDASMTPWTVRKFAASYNGLAKPKRERADGRSDLPPPVSYPKL